MIHRLFQGPGHLKSMVVYVAYIHCISSLLFWSFACSPLFFTILFYSIPVWAVACGMCRYVFYRCVSVVWWTAVGSLWNVSVCFLSVCVGCLGGCLYCLHSLYILSSLLFLCFLLYSLTFYSILFYSILFPYGRLLVECVGVFFIGVCRLLGRLLSVACGMYRYAFYRCVSVALGGCF